MNITELEKIIKQIDKYQLSEEMKNVEEWFSSLNQTQINNLINLDIHPLKRILNHKDLLVNLVFLNSKYYLEEIRLINDAKSDDIAECLRYIACDTGSLWGPHHEDDMKIIAGAKSNIAECLIDVACNADSLKSSHHEYDMKLIANAKSDDIAECLIDVACNADSLKSSHHEYDMKLIANAKSDDIAECLRYIACDTGSLWGPHHEDDMKLIASVKTDEEALKLKNVILYQLKLEVAMGLIKNAETSEEAGAYKKSALMPITNNKKIQTIFEVAKLYADGDLEKEIDTVFGKRK